MRAPLKILVVCTANVCRSPMAAHFLTAAAADAGLEVEVASSGFLLGDQTASDEVLAVMGERGVDLSSHRSRLTTPAMVAEADVVLTMERRHARDLVLMAPGHSRRIHTVGGAVDLLEAADTTGKGPAEKLTSIGEGRSTAALLGVGEDEVADPYGRGRKENRSAASHLESLSARLINALIADQAPSPD